MPIKDPRLAPDGVCWAGLLLLSTDLSRTPTFPSLLVVDWLSSVARAPAASWPAAPQRTSLLVPSAEWSPLVFATETAAPAGHLSLLIYIR